MHGHVCQLFTPLEGNESVARVDDAVIFLLCVATHLVMWKGRAVGAIRYRGIAYFCSCVGIHWYARAFVHGRGEREDIRQIAKRCE